MKDNAEKKVFDVLARTFAQEDVDTCFALLGDANMNWATRLSEQGVRMIYVRHEHCSVAAAMAYARKSGDVGLASVTCGPGVTQLMTALPAAVRARLPVVVLAGEAPLKSGWYNQGIDQAPLVTATGAAYHSLHMPERMPIAIRDAFLQARRERRPVVIGIPFDVQNRTWTGSDDLPTPSHKLLPKLSPIPPHPNDVKATAGLVSTAEKVVVIAGMGAVEAQAGPACRALAAKVGGLLATSLPARGLFHDDPYCIGISGSYTTEVGHEYLAEADLVILVGCSLAFHLGGGGQLWPNAKMVHIDVDPLAVSQGQEVATHHLRADAKLGVEAITEALPASANPWRSNAIAERIRVSKPDSFEVDVEPDLFDPRDVVEALEEHLPSDWELINSSGHCAGFTAHMPSRPQEKFLSIREFGAIGNGTSFAMGVAAARPDSKVVLFDGDGSLLMNIQELETIKRHNLNILIVAMNDGAYGSEVHKFRSEGLSEEGSVFGYSDFAGIAKGFGLAGHKVTDLADIPKLIAEFAADGGPTVWDFHLSDKVVSSVLRRAHPQPKKSA